ncbi:chemotaxis protein CheW [Schinkia azotoformans]|uniref:Chemotaxis signal transduction protein n=1 Tax=Schinkia azotoformans LMG 9581 TaxID=1131731 RepID=K6BVY0_SCHAZ|nr:chemotaxis protein CheW [Schinkia azotoformans]EKN63070.1 chemotaxis signal transduction protein [Schinkia azotoformans LMG 9581]MED4354657.1 chemotaxis protein CheW [Schinkia azotoformans]
MVKQIENTPELQQYTVFSIGEQLCALLIEEVVEIIRVHPITEVPGVKDFISGMINLRGSIIPVIDLRKRFRMNVPPFHKKTRIIIIHNQGENIGLIVDGVTMVTYVERKNVEPPLEMFNTLEKDCFKGFAKINEQFIGILNLEKVLFPYDEEV